MTWTRGVTCDDVRHACGDSAIVACSGAYGHQYPWDEDVLRSVRIMWGFMRQYTASDNKDYVQVTRHHPMNTGTSAY